MRIKLCLLVLILFSCNRVNTPDYYKLLQPTLKELGLDNFNGKIIAIANDHCRNCSLWILDQKVDYGDSVAIVYDVFAYGEMEKPANSHHQLIESTNDKLSRLKVPNVIGHRIYTLRKNKITAVQELNSKNVDSVLYFLKR